MNNTYEHAIETLKMRFDHELNRNFPRNTYGVIAPDKSEWDSAIRDLYCGTDE